MENTYWGNKGKYQKELDLMYNLVPTQGEVKIPKDLELQKSIEDIRQISRLYYDFYNNGCCNVIDTEREECTYCYGSGYEDEENEDGEQFDCSYCNGECYIDGNSVITEYYKSMVENLEELTKMNLTKVLTRCGSNYGSYSFPASDCKELEVITDKIIELSSEVYESKIKETKNLKSLFEKKYPRIILNDDQPYIEFYSMYGNEFGNMKVSKCLELFYNYVVNSEEAVSIEKCL